MMQILKSRREAAPLSPSLPVFYFFVCLFFVCLPSALLSAYPKGKMLLKYTVVVIGKEHLYGVTETISYPLHCIGYLT